MKQPTRNNRVQHENIVVLTDCFVVPNTLDPDEIDLFLVQVI